MASWTSNPCPICFETAENWSAEKVWYHEEHNHSWDNRTCDGHDICWSCLAQHIETQVISEGKSSIRCPGVGCRYHLVQKDIEYAMWDSKASKQVLDTLARLSSQSCQDRLREMVLGSLSDNSTEWLLRECQPCPKCFVLARRETGCDHIICRCGCDFCFGCGTPCNDLSCECLCSSLSPTCRRGDVFFAAWLRTSYQSPCAWLWEEEEVCEVVAERPSEFLSTIGFWLWIAGVEIPVVWEAGDYCEGKQNKFALPPLQWRQEGEMSSFDVDWALVDEDDFFHFFPDLEEEMTGEWEQDLAGHLRKEAYSRQSHRSLRRNAQRKSPKQKASVTNRVKGAPCQAPKANRLLY